MNAHHEAEKMNAFSYLGLLFMGLGFIGCLVSIDYVFFIGMGLVSLCIGIHYENPKEVTQVIIYRKPEELRRVKALIRRVCVKGEAK